MNYETGLGHGHTIPRYDPPEPYASNTKLCCAMISIPLLFGKAIRTLKIRDQRQLCFYSVFPLSVEKMEFKLKHG